MCPHCKANWPDGPVRTQFPEKRLQVIQCPKCGAAISVWPLAQELPVVSSAQALLGKLRGDT